MPGHRVRRRGSLTAKAEAATPHTYVFSRDDLADALTCLDGSVPVDGPCAGMINADSMADRCFAGASPVLQGRDSPCSHVPGVRWLSTYCRMIDSGAPPQDAAKYDGDHRCFPFQTDR